MTVYYDYKKIVPGGWHPQKIDKTIRFCKYCGKDISIESETYQKYKCCLKCYERTKNYED